MIWISNLDKTAANYAKHFLPTNYLLGEPKASNHFTVEELKSMGLIGLYKRDESESDLSAFFKEYKTCESLGKIMR